MVFHTIAILLLAYFGVSWQNPPPEPGGILVNLGIPDVGQGDENAPKGEPAPPVEKPTPREETPPPPPKSEPRKETAPAKPKNTTPKKEVRKTEDPAAVALRKKKEKERREKAAADRKRAEDERRRRDAAARAEAKRKAEADAKRRAEAARKAEEDRKRKALEDMVSGGLGGGKGSGKGNTGKPGNQGDPNGDPNADRLSGISTGAGSVGGGLSGRGHRKPSPPKDNSQATGIVVVYVCVNRSGAVISAEYTQAGSTTTNSKLKRIAIANAKKYRFDKGNVDKQCGTIRYDFKLK